MGKIQCQPNKITSFGTTIQRVRNASEIPELLKKAAQAFYGESSTETVTIEDLKDTYENNKIIRKKLNELVPPETVTKEEKRISKIKQNLAIKADTRFAMKTPGFHSPIISEMFHNIESVGTYFKGRVNQWVVEAIYKGSSKSTPYIKNDVERSIGLRHLQNQLFEQIVQYLLANDKNVDKDLYYNGKEFIGALYKGDVFQEHNYDLYLSTMGMLYKYLTEIDENISFNFKKRVIPGIEGDVQKPSVRAKYDVYSAAVFLSNFDSVLAQEFGNILKIDLRAFNTFQPSTKQAKYELKTSGIKTLFHDDGHEAEAADIMRDEFTHRILSSIPHLNRDGEETHEYLSTVHFYGLSATFRDFQTRNLMTLSEDPEWVPLSENPKKALQYYFSKILEAESTGYENNSIYKVFNQVIDIVKSLNSYLEEVRAKEELDPELSLYELIAQPLNNSNGATYAIHNPLSGSVTYKQLYSQNLSQIQAQNRVYAKLLSSVNKQHLYNPKDVDALETDEEFSNYLRTRFQILISEDNIQSWKDAVVSKSRNTKSALNNLWKEGKKGGKTEEEVVLSIVRANLRQAIEVIIGIGGKSTSDKKTSLFEAIESREQRVAENPRVAETETQGSVLNPLLGYIQEALEVSLKSFLLRPVTTIETADGDKIPTFKLNNLAYADSEVLLQRLRFEKSNSSTTSYRNLFVNSGTNPILLGTTTRLEIVNKDESKQAVLMTPGENFRASFIYDYLGLMKNKSEFYNVMIGNYSDKNTIILKQIASNAAIGGKSIIGGLGEVFSIKDLRSLVQSQQSSYYSDLYKELVGKYNKLFDLELTTAIESYEKTFITINEKLEKFSKFQLLELAKHKKVDIVEELDYAVYLRNGRSVVRLNQNLFDNISFYSEVTGEFDKKVKFNAFINHEIETLLFDIQNFEDRNNILISEQELSRLLGDHLDIKTLSIFFGLEDGALDDFIQTSEILVDSQDSGEPVSKVSTSVLIKSADGRVNPLLERWMLTNMLFRNEYLNITVKHEYMHSAKKLPVREIGQIGDLQDFVFESSVRYSGMAKRNSSFTATYERGILGSKRGMPLKVNGAVIQDPEAPAYNISGDTEQVKFGDGSTLISGLYSRMIAASYPGKEYDGTLKRFGVMITPYGSAVKKDAEFVITNSAIRNTEKAPISYRNKNEQMLSKFPITIKSYKFDGLNYHYIENGRIYKLISLKIEDNVLVKEIQEINRDGEIVNTAVTNPTTITSLFDIWNAIGGADSGVLDYGDFTFNEDSQDLLYHIVTDYKDPDTGDYVLKDKMIHFISTGGAFKSGAINLNPASDWEGNKELSTFEMSTIHMGPQLDPGHSPDASKVKEITQVISGLAQNSQTADLANEVYEDIAQLIQKAAAPWVNSITNLDEKDLASLYKSLAIEFAEHLAKSPTVDLATSIAEAFRGGEVLPLSNKNFFQPFIRHLIVSLNTKFLSRHYNGIGAILNPSHKSYRIYVVPRLVNGVLENISFSQEEMMTEALKAYTPSEEIKSNIEILNDYVLSLWPPEETTLDNVNLGDVILHPHNGEVYEIDSPDKYYKLKAEYDVKKKVHKVYHIPRDLKPAETNYQIVRTVNKDIEKLREKELYTNIELSKLAKVKVQYVTSSELNKIAIEKGVTGIVEAYYNTADSTIYIDKLFKGTASGNRLLIHEAVGHQGLQVLFKGEDYDTYKNIMFGAREYLYRNASKLLERTGIESISQLATNNGWDLSTETGELSVIEELLALQAEQNVSLSWVQKAIGKLQILLAKVFGLTKPMGWEGVAELILMSHKAVLSGQSLSTQLEKSAELLPEPVNQTLFDFDSVRLLYGLTSDNGKIKLGDSDLSILEQFADKFSLRDSNGELNKSKVAKYLRAWTQRNLDLLQNGMVMNSITDPRFQVNGKIDFQAYFGEDSLIGDIFLDVKTHYENFNSQTVHNFRFEAAELVLPNIYKSTFNTGNASISSILSQGSDFFKTMIKEDYKSDNADADFKVVLQNGQSIYVKFVSQLPSDPMPWSLIKDISDNGRVETYRLDDNGQPLYKKPGSRNDSKIVFTNMPSEDGKSIRKEEVLYIKAGTASKDKNVYSSNATQYFKEFIGSINGVRSIVPLFNNTENNWKYRDSDENIDNFRNVLYNLYKSVTKLDLKNTGEINDQWFEQNKESIVDKLAVRQFASWRKSQEFVVARIPAQSMQSFMPMKNVAYFNTGGNNAYVSMWQIWLQGSDFDIDKAYIMGYGFNRSSQFDMWTDLFDYKSKESLDSIAKLPIPLNVELEYADSNSLFTVDLMSDATWFNNLKGDLTDIQQIADIMSPQDIDKLGEVLRKIKRAYSELYSMLDESDQFISGEADKSRADQISKAASKIIKPNAHVDELLRFINRYNSYEGFAKSKHTLQNSIVSKVNLTISSPTNQVLATSPITISMWHGGADYAYQARLKQINLILTEWLQTSGPKIDFKDLISTLADINKISVPNEVWKRAEKIIKGKTSVNNKVDKISQFIQDLIQRTQLFSSSNSTGMYKQQYQAAVGKQDVGIGANGLKVFFAVSTYYNNWLKRVNYNIESLDEDNIISSNKLFLKELYIQNPLTNTLEKHTRISVADTNMSKAAFSAILSAYGYEDLQRELQEINRIQTALAISGFISGATDNAKELIMAKINATTDLAAMHMYMLTLGFSAEQIAVYMNSDLVRYIAKGLQTNLFNSTDSTFALELADSYEKLDEKLIFYNNSKTDLHNVVETFKDIYAGGAEISAMAKIFKVNGAITANVEALNDFLNLIEMSMFESEHATFGFAVEAVKRIDKTTIPKDSLDYNIVKKAVDEAVLQGANYKSVNIDGTTHQLNSTHISFRDITLSIFKKNKHLGKLYQTSENQRTRIFDYIWDTLRDCSEIKTTYISYSKEKVEETTSIIGGNFDARYYLHPDNKQYRNAAKRYYNLIKNTLNVFDILDNVPHFREMTHSVGTTFNIALITSKKFNFVFSYYRDLLRNYGPELDIEKKESKKSYEDDNKPKEKKTKALKHALGNRAFPYRMSTSILNKGFWTFDTYLISSWLKSSNKGAAVADYRFSAKDMLALTMKDTEATEEKPSEKVYTIPSVVFYTSDEAKLNSAGDLRRAQKLNLNLGNRVTKVTPTSEDFIIDLTTDTGIANFKVMVEDILLPALELSNKTAISELISLKGLKSAFNLFGLQLAPTYGISSLNNPVSIENFLRLVGEFNKLDKVIENSLRVRTVSGKVVKWGDLFFLYNLIVNNEAYGDNRLTPLFQDYIKDMETIAYDYFKFARKVDIGEIDIFNIDQENENIRGTLKREQDQNIIYLTTQVGGRAELGAQTLRIFNSDYVINTITPSLDFKESLHYQTVLGIRALLRSQNLIINYNCE